MFLSIRERSDCIIRYIINVSFTFDIDKESLEKINKISSDFNISRSQIFKDILRLGFIQMLNIYYETMYKKT